MKFPCRLTHTLYYSTLESRVEKRMERGNCPGALHLCTPSTPVRCSTVHPSSCIGTSTWYNTLVQVHLVLGVQYSCTMVKYLVQVLVLATPPEAANVFCCSLGVDDDGLRWHMLKFLVRCLLLCCLSNYRYPLECHFGCPKDNNLSYHCCSTSTVDTLILVQ